MIHPVLWYRDAEGIYRRHPDAPPELGAVLLGRVVLNAAGALTVREHLDAQIGDSPNETALAVAAWRQEHPAAD